VAGCTDEGDRGGRGRGSSPEPVEPQVDPDVAVAAAAVAEQRAVLALLEATVERHPGLAASLAPVIATHEAHVAVLADAVPEDVSIGPSTSPTPSPPTAPSTPASSSPADDEEQAAVPARPAAALAAVAQAERDLAAVTKRHAFKAQSGAFARVLGSMAGAVAQHATVLGGAAGGRR
jgi:hypothetical protein